MLISLVSGNNLLKCFNPAEEPLDGTALFVEFRIEPDLSPVFRMFSGSPIDQDIALDLSFSVVLSDLPGIIGCICGDDRGAFLHPGNLKRFGGWLVEPRIMDVCRGNCADKRKAVPIDQSTQFVSVYLFIVIIARLSPFFRRDIFRIRCTMREIDYLDLVARWKKVEEDRLIHSFLAQFEVISVNHRSGAVFRRYIGPGASGGQNIQDAVDQPAGITPGAADMRLCWGRYFGTISQRSPSIPRNAMTPGFIRWDL